MRFKQNRFMIIQVLIGCLLPLLGIVPLCVVYLKYHAYSFAAGIFGAYLAVLVLVGIMVQRTIPGFLTNEIEIDSRGITLFEKGEAVRFLPWEEITEAERFRKSGTYAIALKNREEEEIWFFLNDKIEQRIREALPDLEIK